MTGIALVEVYHLDSAASSKLANISTRGFVKTGESITFAGFVLIFFWRGRARSRSHVRNCLFYVLTVFERPE